MGRVWVLETKEVQDTTICWQTDGHSILGRKKRYYVGPFTLQKYIGVGRLRILGGGGGKV